MPSRHLVLAGMAGHNPPLECEAYINNEPAVQAVDFVEVGSGPSALHPPVTAFRAFDPAPPHGDPRWTCLLRISEERLLEAGVSPRPPDRAVALPPPELTKGFHAQTLEIFEAPYSRDYAKKRRWRASSRHQ